MSVTTLLRRALADHQTGALDIASARYRRILLRWPDSADATYLLGMTMLQTGRPGLAAALIGRAVATRPNEAGFHLDHGNALRDSGDAPAARMAYETALRLAPENPEIHNALGLLLRALSEMEPALARFDAGLRQDPAHAGLGYNRAMTLQMLGRLGAAVAGYDAVLAIQPGQLDAINNRARALHQMGALDQALAGFVRLLVMAPDYASAWNNFGIGQRDVGETSAALAAFERACIIDPRHGEAHNNIGASAWALGQEERALSSYRRAVALRPDLPDVALNLASGLAARGHYQDALAAYDAAAEAHPDDARIPIRRALTLPQVCDSVAEIAGLRAGIDSFLGSDQAAELRVADPVTEVGAANFYFVYHGLDDRPLAERIAAFHRRCCPRLSWIAPHCREGARHRPGARPRIGICSKYLNRHTIGLLFGGVIERIAENNEFELFIFRAPGRKDDIAARIDAAADHVVRLPNELTKAREAIADARLDVLLYTDIGMEPLTYFLAFARLAPTQIVTWGHPVTTGLDSLDGYLSMAAFEPPDGDGHYTEGLRRLRHILMHYTPPALTAPANKQDFNLPPGAAAYVCPQNVFKLHPDYDSWLAGILRADPTGRIVLIEGVKDGWTHRLRERMQRSLPDVLDRVRFLPHLPTQRYFELLSAADVILDPIHFGGGNTTFHALSLGVPVITTPGAFQRSRFASGTYSTIGVEGPVAADREDYVAKAVALGRDPGERARLSRELRDAAGDLRQRHEPADELAELLREMIEAPG